MPVLKLKSLEGMDDATKALFKKEGEEFVFEIEDVSGLKKKVDELLHEKKTSEQKRKEEEEKARKAAEDAARKGGDIESLTKSYDQKIAQLTADFEEKTKSFNQMINDLTVGSTATSLANKLAIPGSADVLIPHLRNRLAVDMSNGSPVVKVLDVQGKPSAFTLQDLENEIAGNKAFAPLIVGTRGSGAGYQGGNGGQPSGNTMKRAEFDKLDPAKKMEFSKKGGAVTD